VNGTERWDVVIAGAGPGGSTLSALLAEAGLRVLCLDKDEFPRFHIGESLLPATDFVVETLGVEPDPNVFLFKGGAQFICEKTGRKQAFDFAHALPGPQRYAWQVERAKFDTILRDKAREYGADVRHGIRVSDVVFHDDHVEVLTDGGTYDAKYFVDASGQGRLLATKMRSGKAYKDFGKAAVFTHFSGLSDAAREEIGPGNDIRVMIVPDGWGWLIPLTNNRLSVGLVSRVKGLKKADLEAYIAESPLIGRLTAGATRHESRMIGNFSYKNTRATGARYACVGDAACFIDPVFSSGVTLAIRGAKHIAELLIPAFADAREGEADLLAPIEEKQQRGYDTFASLVYRFYNTRFIDNMIFGAPAEGELRPGVISVLAGDVFRDGNPFQDLLLSSKRNRPGVTDEEGTDPSGADPLMEAILR
jgi:flavin-dependent dehydrogenase